jgi:nucleolar protein 15
MKKVKKVTEGAAVPEKKRKGSNYTPYSIYCRYWHCFSATEEAAPVAVKKSKTPKPTLENGPKPEPKTQEVNSDKIAKKSNGDTAKKAKSAAKELKPTKTTKTKESQQPKAIDPPSDVENANADAEDDDEESEIDDQTEALLKGFESDGDDENVEKEGGLEEGQDVPTVPAMSKSSKKQLQRVIDYKLDDKPGVVYVGRIPHGFFEHEMREYFEQFGKILKLRLSRNKKTGASKHVAWIQFESATVADIVAKTMDNYLLFSHILKVKVVPNEQIPPNLWKGANKRFKKVPWNKVVGRELAEPKVEGSWEKLSAREQSRRDKKAEQLKAIGYEFESPKIISAKGIAKKVEQPVLTNEESEVEVKAIEEAPTPKAEGTKKTEKKEKKVEVEAIEAAPAAEAEGLKKKEKKDRKRKAKAVEVAKAKPDAWPVALYTIIQLRKKPRKSLPLSPP